MVEIRPELAADHAAVRTVNVEAFSTPAEANLVEQLRRDGCAVLSLVAVAGHDIVGHVMLSRMRSPANALGLAPVADLASFRRQGIAGSLIREGLSRAKVDAWGGAFVLGDPGCYRRFGFDAALAMGFTSPYAGPHLRGLELKPGTLAAPKGELSYPAAFDAL